MTERVCVVGSGPAAVSCAHVLAEARVPVTILDVGFDLDQASRGLLEQYRRDRDPDALVDEIHRLRAGYEKLSAVQPGKYLFGSDHPYRTIPDTEVESGDDAVIRSSLGKGGLTAVWGATVCTVVPKDIGDWPIGFADLEPHYRALEKVVPVASPHGEMRGLFPIDIGSSPGFPLGSQGQALLSRLQRCRDALACDGIHVGRAKLAVGAKYSADGTGCTPCGLCMHGCPNDAIFSASHLLDALRRRPGVEYRPGVLVESFAETGGAVEVGIKELDTGNRTSLRFDRLFVACGVVNTTAIVARSLGMTDHEFTIRDSQKFIFPLLCRRAKGAVRARDNTLAQVYLTVDNQEVSGHVVQVQYYGYNDLILEPLRGRLGNGVAKLFARLAVPLLERLMIAFVYLHSNESGTLSLTVHESGEGRGMGEVRGHANPRSHEVVRALLRLLRRHRVAHGGRVLGLGLQATKPGDSQHIGGTLPMSAAPGRHETDVLGRPSGCEQVHVVDASVFPSVPGTPIAYTAMANASRIAAGALRVMRVSGDV